MTEDKLDDFIQKAVNKGYEESVNRWKKHIDYKITQANHKKKLNKIKGTAYLLSSTLFIKSF